MKVFKAEEWSLSVSRSTLFYCVGDADVLKMLQSTSRSGPRHCDLLHEILARSRVDASGLHVGLQVVFVITLMDAHGA